MVDKNNDTEPACSCACFDSQGRLVDWNTGFESEFARAASNIAAGASFREILQQAHDRDHVIRVYLPNPNQPQDAARYIERWPKDLSTTHQFKYWDQGHIVSVRETRTVSRGIIRIATAETNEPPVPEEKDHDIGGTATGRKMAASTAGNEQDELLRAAALETSNSILLLRLRTEQKLKSLSITDGLTGLANRRHFNEVFESQWKRAMDKRTSLGIAIMDIDYFKQYNDHYGHSAGDTCLKQVAAALSESMRQGMDLVCRYGGEEFAVILPGVDQETAKTAAERARAGIAELNEPHEAINGIVTVSIGVAATIPSNGMTAQELINQADEALYRAKESGRNRVVDAATPGNE